MTRFTTDRKEPRRQRFSGPWNANPWISSRTIGPRNYQGIDRQQAQGLSASLPLPERAAAMVEPGAARERRTKERKQQRNALGTWEDEGGKNS